mmetsp:Transcript_15819/g.30893  ORF Transcript_15819/g.30893 Transcript_15819/m.30893 type:complete len:260 (-) Transcript_15819:168-947(-)
MNHENQTARTRRRQKLSRGRTNWVQAARWNSALHIQLTLLREQWSEPPLHMSLKSAHGNEVSLSRAQTTAKRVQRVALSADVEAMNDLPRSTEVGSTSAPQVTAISTRTRLAHRTKPGSGPNTGTRGAGQAQGWPALGDDLASMQSRFSWMCWPAAVPPPRHRKRHRAYGAEAAEAVEVAVGAAAAAQRPFRGPLRRSCRSCHSAPHRPQAQNACAYAYAADAVLGHRHLHGATSASCRPCRSQRICPHHFRPRLLKKA